MIRHRMVSLTKFPRFESSRLNKKTSQISLNSTIHQASTSQLVSASAHITAVYAHILGQASRSSINISLRRNHLQLATTSPSRI